jgi:hypothetical protein
VLPGNGPDGSLLCVDCAGMTLSLRCQECGVEDNLHERGRCPRCILRRRIVEYVRELLVTYGLLPPATGIWRGWNDG